MREKGRLLSSTIHLDSMPMIRIASVKQLYKGDKLNDNKASSDSSDDIIRQKTSPMIKLNGLMDNEAFEPNLTL